MKVVLSATYAFGFLLRGSVAFRPTTSTTTNKMSSSNNNNKLFSASNNILNELAKKFSSSLTNSNSSSSNSKYYTIGLTGSGGLIGTALRDELNKRGSLQGKPIRIVRLKRDAAAAAAAGSSSSSSPLPDAPGECQLGWNPNADKVDEIVNCEALREIDAVVHLSGENISTGQGILGPLGIRPWTESKKKEIIDSRVVTTAALAKAIATLNKKTDFLVASGIGAYGSDFVGPDTLPVDETVDISITKGFLAEVSRQWEKASQEAKMNGSRVVNLRNGVVLSKKGGAMAKLYPIFFLGGGGIVGSGKQYFPFISARDMARAMIHVLETPRLQGPVNMCAPGGCTNEEFTKAMGKVMGRPTILPFPAFAVSLLFGEMGEEVLLGGTRANPTKLLESGFEFLHPGVEAAVQSAVDETI